MAALSSSLMLMEVPQKARQVEGDIRLPTGVGTTWDNNLFPEAASLSLTNRANASLQDNKMQPSTMRAGISMAIFSVNYP